MTTRFPRRKRPLVEELEPRILFDGAEDLRPLPFDSRRARLEDWFARTRPARMDLSALIPFATIEDLAEIRAGAREAA